MISFTFMWGKKPCVRHFQQVVTCWNTKCFSYPPNTHTHTHTHTYTVAAVSHPIFIAHCGTQTDTIARQCLLLTRNFLQRFPQRCIIQRLVGYLLLYSESI